MAIYTVIDNRDIDNDTQNWLSSVPSLCSFWKLSNDFKYGDDLWGTVISCLNTKNIQDLTSIYRSLQATHLSDLTQVCTDITIETKITHLSDMTQLCADISALLKQSGGTSGGALITYKYWDGVEIPPHPESGIDITTKCMMAIEPTEVEYQSGIPATVNVSVFLNDNFEMLTQNQDYLVNYYNNQAPGTAIAKATGMGQYTGSLIKTFTIVDTQPTDISSAQITLNQSIFTYDGTVKTPQITQVTLGGQTLVRNTDYEEIEAEEHSDAGTYALSIQGCGEYTGIKSVQYVINPKDITLYDIYLKPRELDPKAYTQTAAGVAVTPEVGGLETLLSDVEYNITYSNNLYPTSNAMVQVSGIGNYGNYKDLTFIINPSPASDPTQLSNAQVTFVNGSTFTYNGLEIQPEVTVKDANMETIPTSAYSISYINNQNAATLTDDIKPTVQIVAVNERGYYGSKNAYFTINPADIEYTAAQDVTAPWNNTSRISVIVSKPITGCTIKYGTTKESKTTTNPSFTGTANLGEHTVYYDIIAPTYDGIHKNYNDIIDLSARVTLTAVYIQDAHVTLGQTSYALEGEDDSTTYSCTPTVTVKIGNETLNASDYSLTYTNNTGTISNGETKTASATVGTASGKNVITGSVSKNYSISYTKWPTYYLTNGGAIPTESGSVTISDNGEKQSSEGSYGFECSATANIGYVFKNWVLSGSATCDNLTTSTTTVDSTATTQGGASVSAIFIPTLKSLNRVGSIGNIDAQVFTKGTITNTTNSGNTKGYLPGELSTQYVKFTRSDGIEIETTWGELSSYGLTGSYEQLDDGGWTQTSTGDEFQRYRVKLTSDGSVYVSGTISLSYYMRKCMA